MMRLLITTRSHSLIPEREEKQEEVEEEDITKKI